MSNSKLVLLVAALVTTNVVSGPACNWNNPGQAPLTIPSADALGAYTDISAAKRKDLQRRIAGLLYDDMVAITPTSIAGKFAYHPDIVDMLWGPGRPCRGVADRRGWAPDHAEYAFVYFVGDGLPDVMVATSCRNPARITRAPDGGVVREAALLPPAEFTPLPPMLGAEIPVAPPLVFTPPAAATLPPAIPLALAEPATVPLVVGRGGGAAPMGMPPVFVGGGVIFVPTPAVPEPATWALWLAGLGLYLQRRRRKPE